MWRKDPDCVDGLLIHRDREHGRPVLESSESETNIGCSFGVLPTVNLVSSPNVERKTGSLTVNEVESGRERTPEYCATSNVVEGGGAVVPENRGQKADIIGHFGETVFMGLVFFFLLPQNEGGGEGKPK